MRLNSKSSADYHSHKKSGVITSPAYFMTVTITVVFAAEAVVMLILNRFIHLNMIEEAFADSVLLSIIIFPLLYLLLFRPLSKMIIAYRKTLHEVRTLRGLLSICMKCKKIRKPDGDEYSQESWQNIEQFIEDNSDTEFSHGLCPECYKVWRKDMGLKDTQ